MNDRSGDGSPPPPVVVDDYLSMLAVDLPGPHRVRTAALDEVRDGLVEAIADGTAHGLSPELAARAALADLGPPATVARAFAPELATALARRTMLGYVITGPLVGIWWLLLLVPDIWPPRPQSWWAAIPAMPLIGVAVAAAVVVLATTGSLIRWIPESEPQWALRAAIGVGLGCLLGDLTVLGTLAARALGTDWSVPPLLAALAITGSLVRVASAVSATLGCRRTLQQLP